MYDLNIIIHISTVIRKLLQSLRAVFTAYRKPFKQLLNHILMSLMEHSGKQGFPLNYIEIVHDHFIIAAVFLAWHKLEFIALTAEVNPL